MELNFLLQELGLNGNCQVQNTKYTEIPGNVLMYCCKRCVSSISVSLETVRNLQVEKCFLKVINFKCLLLLTYVSVS